MYGRWMIEIEKLCIEKWTYQLLGILNKKLANFCWLNDKKYLLLKKGREASWKPKVVNIIKHSQNVSLKRFLTERFLTESFLTEGFFTEGFLTERFLTERFLTERFLT